MRRGNDALPRQGTESPWRVLNNYLRDAPMLRRSPIDDGVLEFQRETTGGRATRGRTGMTATRRALHGVAEYLLAGPQYRASGTIRLRVSDGGFATVAEPEPARRRS